MRIDPDTCDDPVLLAAEVRRLRAVIARGDYPIQDSTPIPDNTPTADATPDECSVPPEWTSRPYYVDPPSGWRYGFPQLYDPQADGDMRAWMIANGYPEHLAQQGLACTFSEYRLCTDTGEK